MFNLKHPNTYRCTICGDIHYIGESSYIKSVKWNEINNKENFKRYLDIAVGIKDNIESCNIKKNIL